MLIDMHAHSSAISRCCKISCEGALKEAVENGIDGVILTNHYQKAYLKDCSLEELVERYIGEFYAARRLGEEIGCKVFFGIEVTLERHDDTHMLIYGVGPEFLRKYPRIFSLTQKQLYDLVRQEDGLLIHAHPFRKGGKLLDVACMDGVEFNCHPKYEGPCSELLQKTAKDYGLLLTCGGDYHADTFRPKCGMIFPDHVQDHKDIRDWLLCEEAKRFYLQEPDHTEYVVTVKKA